MSLITFGIAVAGYFVLHSLLAAEGVKAYLTKSILPGKYYRLFYNAFAIVSLAVVMALYFQVGQRAVLQSALYLTLPGWAFILAGLVWIGRALAGYDLSEFSGLGQLKTGPASPRSHLQVKGLNGLVRHPLYFGTLMVAWGLFLVLPSDAVLLFSAITTVYIYVGSTLEERKLAQQFGDAYRLYQENVPRIVPFRFDRRKR